MNNPSYKFAALAALIATAPLGASAYFSVKIDDVSKKADKVYIGTAGSSQMTVYTEDCFHEPKKGEWASFTWYGENGLLTFGSNSDVCTVKRYTSTNQ